MEQLDWVRSPLGLSLWRMVTRGQQKAQVTMTWASEFSRGCHHLAAECLSSKDFSP